MTQCLVAFILLFIAITLWLLFRILNYVVFHIIVSVIQIICLLKTLC